MNVITRSLIRVSYCVLCIITQSCSHPSISAEEQDVMEATIAQCRFLSPTAQYVIHHQTSIDMLRLEYPSYDEFSEKLKKEALYKPRDVWEAVNDFLVKNRNDTELVFPRHLSRNEQFFAATTERRLQPKAHSDDRDKSRTEYWDSFWRYYPSAKGMIVLSRPGFDSKHGTAVIHISKMTGHGGGGSILILKRLSGRWQLQDYDRDLEHFWTSESA